MRVELERIRPWRHDLGHCLHTTAGVLLAHHGLDPVEALGAAWGFHYPGDLRREEYYLPGHAESLFGGLAPYHRVSSRWHTPADAAQGWAQVRERVAAGEPVAVAADNYHLPFRPAHGDVHTNHLLTVIGFDDERGEVLVVDPVPPAFRGPIPLAALTAARDSGNEVAGDRDLFFTANAIGNRWLELHVDAEQPAFDAPFVRKVLEANAAGFRAPHDPATSGLPGLRTYLDGAWERLSDGGAVDEGVVDEVFVVIGPLCAVAGLHADFLDHAADRLGAERLRLAARLVDRVAHHWTALRIAVGTARDEPAAALPGLRARTRALVLAHERALAVLDAESARL